jgi:thiamine biosynthesis protein ThiS
MARPLGVLSSLIMIKLSLNGQMLEVQPDTTIAALVASYPFSPRTILVERNGVALHRGEWAETVLQSDDRIEFIKVVAGG